MLQSLIFSTDVPEPPRNSIMSTRRSIQPQLDTKAATANPTFSTGITLPVTGGTPGAVTWSATHQNTSITLNGKLTQVLITPDYDQTGGNHTVNITIANSSITADSIVFACAAAIASDGSDGVCKLSSRDFFEDGMHATVRITLGINQSSNSAVKFKLNICVI